MSFNFLECPKPMKNSCKDESLREKFLRMWCTCVCVCLCVAFAIPYKLENNFSSLRMKENSVILRGFAPCLCQLPVAKAFLQKLFPLLLRTKAKTMQICKAVGNCAISFWMSFVWCHKWKCRRRLLSPVQQPSPKLMNYRFIISWVN